MRFILPFRLRDQPVTTDEQFNEIDRSLRVALSRSPESRFGPNSRYGSTRDRASAGNQNSRGCSP